MNAIQPIRGQESLYKLYDLLYNYYTDIIRRMRIPVREAFSYGKLHISLFFNEA